MSLLTTRKSEPPKVRLTDDAAFAAAAGRLAELKVRERELRAKKAAMGLDLGREEARRDLDRRATELLTSGNVVESDAAHRDRLRDNYAALVDELRVVERAVAMQERLVREERARVGRALADRLRPGYAAIVERLAAAIRELSDAAQAELAFREALTLEDVPLGSIRPMPFIGDAVRLDLPYSSASLWMREAREHYGIE